MCDFGLQNFVLSGCVSRISFGGKGGQEKRLDALVGRTNETVLFIYFLLGRGLNQSRGIEHVTLWLVLVN